MWNSAPGAISLSGNSGKKAFGMIFHFPAGFQQSGKVEPSPAWKAGGIHADHAEPARYPPLCALPGSERFPTRRCISREFCYRKWPVFPIVAFCGWPGGKALPRPRDPHSAGDRSRSPDPRLSLATVDAASLTYDPWRQADKQGYRKEENASSTLVAPATRRRAMLSGTIRCQQEPTNGVQGAQRPGG